MTLYLGMSLKILLLASCIWISYSFTHLSRQQIFTPSYEKINEIADTSFHPALLSVDLGLRTGIAYYGKTGYLEKYTSFHFKDLVALETAIRDIIHSDIEYLYAEGDMTYQNLWRSAIEKMSGR